MRAFQGDPFACFHAQTVTQAFVAFDLLRCSRGAGGDIAVKPDDLRLCIDVNAVVFIPGHGTAHALAVTFDLAVTYC